MIRTLLATFAARNAGLDENLGASPWRARQDWQRMTNPHPLSHLEASRAQMGLVAAARSRLSIKNREKSAGLEFKMIFP
jgi:hypothetical protein